MPQSALKVLLAVLLLITPLAAQMGARGGLPLLAPTASPVSRSFPPSLHHHPSYQPGFYLATPFWTDDYSSPYAQPPVFVIQTQPEVPQRSISTFEEPKPAAPLMIEWQEGRYVRRTSDATTSPSRQPDYAEPPSALSPARPHSAVTAPPAEPPPAIFVFRDGHREQSSDYSIISGVIYSRGNYWTTGSWSRKIPITDLDVPATLQANREHGVPFRLPTAPNEVITRP